MASQHSTRGQSGKDFERRYHKFEWLFPPPEGKAWNFADIHCIDGLPYRYYSAYVDGKVQRIVVSNGPNQERNLTGSLVIDSFLGREDVRKYGYDPSNGTISGGDIIRVFHMKDRMFDPQGSDLSMMALDALQYRFLEDAPSNDREDDGTK